MSFHGGMLGVTLAMVLFAWQRKRTWLQVTDFVAPMVPLGLAAGRFGNFINGELWGRVTSPTAPWAMLFPGASQDDAIWLAKNPALDAQWHLKEVFEKYQMLPRHPSQLYEIALEGFALFIVMWLMSRKQRPVGAISAVFLIGYGLARFTVEFAREPRRLSRLAGGEFIDGTMAFPADDHRWNRPADLVVQARAIFTAVDGERWLICFEQNKKPRGQREVFTCA